MLLSVLPLLLLGCEGAPSTPAPAPSGASAKAENAIQVGSPLRPGQVVSVADLVARPDEFTGKPVLVSGTVRQACTRKGCWMELAGGLDKAQPGCRVTFKDYAFFVPTDSAGSTAKVEGSITVQTVSAAQVKHMEEEGGHFPVKNPDGTANEVRIVATGVELVRPGT